MNARDMKDGVFGQFARIGKAVSAPKRIELLDLLCQGPHTVEVLAGNAGLSVANASQHLQILRNARLVKTEKRGLFVEYQLADEGVLRFVNSMHEVAKARFAEISTITDAYLKARGALEQVSGEELLRRVRRKEVFVLDVRPAEEFRAGHIPGARSMPICELKRRVAELPRKQQIVAYCRGPHCVMAIEAVEWMRRKGLRAVRMEHGVIEWQMRGWPLHTGA